MDDQIRWADEIVNAYAALLEVKGSILRAASDLPAPKDDIKKALLITATCRRLSGIPLEGVRAVYRTAYCLLSRFVSDEVAERDAERFAALESWAHSRTRTDEELRAAARAFSAAAEGMEDEPDWGAESLRLAAEFDRWFAEMEG